MCKRLKLIFLMFLTFSIFSIHCKKRANYKIYKNDEASFQFKYNQNKIDIYENNKNLEGKIYFKIDTEEISNISENEFLGYDKQSALKEKEKLEQGKIGSGIGIIYDKKMIELIEVDNKYGEIITSLTMHSVEDVIFERKLLFFNNNYRVIITVYGDTIQNKIIESMSKYFSFKKGLNSYIWAGEKYDDVILEFFKNIKNGNASKITLDWFNSIYDITKEIKLK